MWEGSESRFGKTMWQGIDSEIIGEVGAEAGKYIFTRARPNPQQQSLPLVPGRLQPQLPEWRGAVSAALVTPYVIEYAQDNPAAYALLLLPLYVGAGRIKNQAHWQTDVLAGWAVGGLSGWYAHSRDTPITDPDPAARLCRRLQDAILTRRAESAPARAIMDRGAADC